MVPLRRRFVAPSPNHRSIMKGISVAKRTNYSFEKRQKDLAKKKKREEKLKKKQERKASGVETIVQIDEYGNVVEIEVDADGNPIVDSDDDDDDDSEDD